MTGPSRTTTLTEAERTILAATRFYCDCTDAHCSMRGELDRAVEQILAAREAALLDRLGGFADDLDHSAQFFGAWPENASHVGRSKAYSESAERLRAELLRQGGGE